MPFLVWPGSWAGRLTTYRGPSASFIASRGKRDWLMERFESDLGPVQHHHLGALQLRWEDDRPYAERILFALWDDLRALSAASS